ncbi:MAG: extracellular solute-binding protein [Oscillospiraceae bacterium]|nr:extracellular solute-binding protein [Oscillospiraceae bacterium]
MQKKLKSASSLLLTAALLAGLCACKKTGEEANYGNQLEGLEKVRLEHVYTMSYIDTGTGLPDTEETETAPGEEPGDGEYGEFTDEYIRSVTETESGDLYISNQFYHEVYKDNEYSSENGVRIYRIDHDGGNYRRAAEFSAESSESENGYSYKSINSVMPCADGTFWYGLTEESYDWSDPGINNYNSSSYLVHASGDGTELYRIALSELPVGASAADIAPGAGPEPVDNLYISSIYSSKSGDIVLLCGNRVLTVSEYGKLKSDISPSFNDNQWLSSLVQTGSGDFIGLVIDWEENRRTLYALDPASGAFDELGDLPFADAYDIIGGAGTTVLSNTGSAVYSYDYVSGEKRELVNWINSDINPNRINNVFPLSDGRFIVMEYSRDFGKNRPAFLTPASDGDAVEKYIITFASVDLDGALQDAIIDYNKQNGEFRIQFIDYSQYNTDRDYSGGTKQLNLDIIAGKIPDLFLLDQLPFQTYASKGLLTDIGALLDSDPDFDRDEYFDNILSAPAFKGHSYSIIPSFSVMTVVGKAEFVGSEPGWTIDDLRSLMEAHPGSSVFDTLTKTDVLSFFMNMALDKYIDYDSGACSFDSEHFIKMLELVNSFPDTIDWDSYYSSMTDEDWKRMDNMYRDGSTLLNIAYVSNYNGIKSQMNNFGGEITYIGFPVPEGVGSVIIPRLEIGVSSKSKLKGACRDFIEYLISDEFLDEYAYAFPIKRSVLDRRRSDAMDPTPYRYSADGIPVSGSDLVVDSVMPTAPGPGGYYSYWDRPLSREQADKIDELVSSVNTVYRDTKDIMAIIEEESGAYFSGQKSAQTAADIIQSRVQIYVNEIR